MNLMSPELFLKRMKDGCVVVDTRAIDKFADGFASGSLSVFFDASFEANLEWLLEDDTRLLLIAEERVRNEIEHTLRKSGRFTCEGFLDGHVEDLLQQGTVMDILFAIDIEEFKLDYQYDEFFLIDIRPADDFAEGHLEDSENIVLEELQDMLTDMDANASYYVYGANAADAMTAASLFRRNGCTRVRALAVGFEVLKASGIPCFNANKKKGEKPFSKN